MRLMTCALVLSALAAGPTFAKEAAPATAPEKATRTVFVCDNSAMTRRAFAREYGRVEFVTAEKAAAKGAAWTAPKCITPAEARRLKQLAGR
jgi:hypothetical protein